VLRPITSRGPAMVGLAVSLAVALSTLAVGLAAVRGDSYPPARGDADAPAFAAVASEGAPPIREQLALHLARNPRDGRGWMLLARIEFDRDRFPAAADAFRKAIDASPKVARDPGVWCEYADALAMAQGGILAGRPRELIERALTLDARHARALEMAGSAAFEAGDFAAAARSWRRLLAQLTDGTQERRDLALAIREAERRVIASDPIADVTLR
jgi:cytochrome c-type biogenesis protein CcmH